MGFSMGASMQLSHKVMLKQAIALPYVNWSLVDAYKEESDKTRRFKKKDLEGIDGLPIEERLKKIDEANEIFRFHYVQAEDQHGKKGRYYKVPLMRDFNVDIEGIKVPITKQEYQRATSILEGAGRLQRIVRAVPYAQIRQDVKEHVEEKGYSLDDIVIVGVDRGGRVPTHVMRQALGQSNAYFIKVDQAGGGSSGSVDKERLDQMISQETLKGKYVIFIDSTVDSGRQIEVLEKYFKSPDLKDKIGHKGWTVVGSNENGQTLDNHLNINWGLNPDESFEDNPLLMGVDYAGYSHNQVRAQPSQTSTAIRNALNEVPKGVVLDYENLNDLVQAKDIPAEIRKAESSKRWQNAKTAYQSHRRTPSQINEFPKREPFSDQRRSVAIVGSGSFVDLSDAESEYLALALSPRYVFNFGTPDGNPGRVLRAVNEYCRDSNVTLFQPEYMRGKFYEAGDFPVEYSGQSKDEFRENFVRSSDAVLVLGGEDGTLHETIVALHAGKSVIAVKDYGAVAKYLSSKKFKKFDNLSIVDSLPEAVDKLREIC